MFGLKQITLHNSYYNGLTVAVSADGHTNCSGTNAAGKTSMLQLVPFFYGCAPSKFNPKNKDKLPFVDFVLPSHNSMIIYDYQRVDGNCCAVVYRSSNSSVAYRLIKATSREAFFNETVAAMMKGGVPAAEIFTKIATLGYELSTQLLTISEYAAVIQGDAATLRRMGDKNRMRDAQRFGLATTSQPMRFMGEMTFTLLKRARMYEELKRMIASTLFDYSAPAIPKHRNNERLSRDLKGLREFEQRKDSIRHCIALHNERLHLVNASVRYARGVRLAMVDAETKLQDIEAQRVALLRQQELIETDYEEQKSRFWEQKIESEGRLKDLGRSITDAENEQTQWLEANIAEKQADFEQLADFREESEIAEEHYQLLLTDSRKIADLRDTNINKIQARINLREAAYQQEIKACNEETDTINQDYQQKLQEVGKEEKQEVEECNAAADEQREKLLPERGRIQALIQSGVLTEEEKLAEVSAEDKLENHERHIDAIKDSLSHQGGIVQQTRVAYEEALARLESTRKKLESTKAAIAHWESILYPADGTLLLELRKNLPDWHENIGKLIRPELLQAKHLAPTIGEGENFYGLEVDLVKLPVSDYAENDEKLQARIEEAITQKRLLEEEKLQQESVAGERKGYWDEAQAALDKFNHDLKLAQNARQAARDFLLRLRHQHKDNIAERKSAFKAELFQLEKQLTEQKNKHQQRLGSIQERFDEQRETLFSDCMALRSEVEARKDQLQANFEDAKTRAEHDIADVKMAYKRQSQDLGIDESTLQSARARSHSTRERYKEVQGFGDILMQYEQWQKNVWLHIDVKRADYKAAQTQYIEAEETLSNLKAEFQQQKSNNKRLQKTLEQQFKQRNEELENARGLLNSHGPVTEGDAVQGELAALCSELEVLLQREKELRNEVLRAVTDALMTVQSNPDSKIYESWKQLNEARLATSTYPELSEQYRLNQPIDLDVLLNRHVPLIREAIIQAIKSVGGAFEEFYRTLRQLETDVGRVSSELKKKVNTNQRIAALRDIELALSSKIAATVDGWDDLEAFIHSWEDWLGGISNELPPENLELSLSRVITHFQSSNIKMDIGSLFDLEIHMVESGRPTCINSNAAFDDASSNGLSYLALIVIFVGLSRYLCPDTNVTLTWPIDELATLDPKNVASLFTMLRNNNIEVFSAFPSTDYNLLQHFTNRYTLERASGARQYLDTPVENADVENVVAALEDN